MGILEGLLQYFSGRPQNSGQFIGRLKWFIQLMTMSLLATQWAQICPGWHKVKTHHDVCPLSPSASTPLLSVSMKLWWNEEDQSIFSNNMVKSSRPSLSVLWYSIVLCGSLSDKVNKIKIGLQ